MSQYFEPISDTEKIEILKKFGSSPEIVKKDVEAIKDWLRKQPHLAQIPRDIPIESFLNLAKFSVEEAKQRIDAFYTIRRKFPQLLSAKQLNPYSDVLLKYADFNYFIPLPKLTNDLSRVIVSKFMQNSDYFDPIYSFIWSFSVNIIRYLEDYSVNNIIIYDLEHITFKHVTKITPNMLKILQPVHKAVLKRSVKSINFINCSSVADIVIRLFKPMLSDKTIERIYVHESMDNLYEIVPKKILPKDYNGEQKSLKELNEILKSKMFEYKAVFDNLDNFKLDEKLRPGKLVNDDILGVYGNFKKLDID